MHFGYICDISVDRMILICWKSMEKKYIYMETISAVARLS